MRNLKPERFNMALTLSNAFGLLKNRRKTIDDAVNGTDAPAAPPAPAPTPPPAPKNTAGRDAGADRLMEEMSKKYGVPMKRGGMVGKAGKRGC